MTTSLKGIALALCLSALTSARAQQTTTATSGTQATAIAAAPSDSRSIPATPVGSEPVTNYSLNLQWNQTSANVSLTFPNSSANAITVLGVQTTGNLFVTDFSPSAAAGANCTIDLMFQAQPNTQSDADVIRLLTSDGIKVLRVALGRPQVASFDTSTLTWAVGDPAVAKVATLTLTNGVQAVSAQAMSGNSVAVASVGNGVYTISVTPLSTAKPMTFPVVVTLNPAVPNVTPVVTCTVTPAN